METPQPVDLNKLKSILGNAKKIMKAADEKFPTKKQSSVSESYSNNYQQPFYSESDEREPEYHTPMLSEHAGDDYSQSVRDYTEEDILKSNLPPIVKEAMLKKPIPKPSMSFSKFSLDGLEELVEKPVKNVQQQQRQPLKETQRQTSSDMITISASQLNELIDKRVNEVIANMFVKTLSEQTIKKTIGTLIKEGRITKK